MTDNLKMALNRLQHYIVSEIESDNILLIFDNEMQKENYKRLLIEKHLNTPDKLFFTLNELIYKIDGLRFKRYWFITDEDLLNLKKR